MINIKNPGIIAIFLNDNQKSEILKNNFDHSLTESFLNRLNQIYPNIPIYSNYNINSNTIFIDSNNERDFLLIVSQYLPKSTSEDEDFDEIYLAYFNGINPLLSIKCSRDLTERHKKYISQYSYSENLPVGIVPTLISREFISTLPDNLNIKVHDFLIKNINNYDTEIYYESPDLRNLRLDFSLNNQRSIEISQQLLRANLSIEYSDIISVLEKNPVIFRGGPSYLEIELYRGCELNCTFCPRESISKENDGTFIDSSLFQKLINETEEISNTFTICLGGMGEPLLHSNLEEILDIGLSSKAVKEIIIETTLNPNTDKLFLYLKTLEQTQKNKIIFIINFTTLKEDSYKQLYKNSTKTVEDILEKIEFLKNTLGKNSVYVQMLKIKEIETEIENYFNFFESKDTQVLLQKYNSYATRLKEKRVSDLTPINREFCWHLSRDIYIQSNGNVSACKQSEEIIIGNIREKNINEIWNKNLDRFNLSFNHKFEQIDLPCLKCDEWYTFNG
jgi:spiro-SPASM protein